MIAEGADPLRPVAGSPNGGPVTTGKPGIHLAPSSFGFSRSPLPALCSRATSCAWRSRLRKIPDGRFRSSRGRAEVRSGGHPWVLFGAQMDARRDRSGVLGLSWRQRWPKRLPKRLDRTRRRRAPNVTHNAVWRTCVPESIGFAVYFEHRAKERKWVPNRCAPDVTHNVFSWT